MAVGQDEHPTRARDMIGNLAGSVYSAEIGSIIGIEVAELDQVGDPHSPFTTIRYDGAHELFGFDGAGGTYHALDDGRVLLIDSEGLAGVIAPDFPSFVGITLGLSSWRDALGFMGEGDLETARAAFAAYDAHWGLSAQLDQPWPYVPELYSTPTPGVARKVVSDHLGYPRLDDPFAALYEAVNGLNDDLAVVDNSEDEYLLFGHMPE